MLKLQASGFLGGEEGILDKKIFPFFLEIFFLAVFFFRQNGAPSGLEKRGLDASIYHKTRKPTEGTQ
ncbi:hypothetical protein [Leptospira borgpetersenii]|uniref:hypothetical protein n=1 Tax=Leptospira borgpetersenii TaxID=174 RepID=UPI0005C6A943|nr:hypothetical protein [Leptospira borgpetersenii]MBF3376164.1 hypothetical protein [Leptospira borgpetersenii serovar Balcanica]